MTTIRIGMAWRVFGGLAGIASFTVVAGAVGVYSFMGFRDTVNHLVFADLPSATLASTLGRRSEEIVAGAPSLALAASQSERGIVMRRIAGQVADMGDIAEKLEGYEGARATLPALDVNKAALVGNLETLNNFVEQRITATQRRESLLTRVQDLGTRLAKLRDAVDQRRLATGSPGDLERWLALAERADTLMLSGLAESRGLAETRPLPVELLQVDIADVIAAEESVFATLPAAATEEVGPLHEELRDLATGDDNVFDVRADEIRLLRSIEATLARNAFFANRFVATAVDLVSSIESEVAERSREMNETLIERSKLLIVIALLCIVGAGGVADQVNRRVVRRVKHLQGAMDAYVAGREFDIPSAGNDEIADMSRALEYLVATIAEREAAQSAAEARLKDAIENIPEGFVVYDSDDRLVLCNGKFMELFGYSDTDVSPGVTQEELFRLDFERGTIEMDPGKTDGFVRDLTTYWREGENRSVDVQLSDGRWLQYSDRGTSSGGRVGIRADITGRKQAEESLRVGEQRLESILRESPVSVLLVRAADNRIVFANARFCELFGISESEALGSTAPQLYADPDDRHTMLEGFEEVGSVRDAEVQMIRADGSEFWALLTVLPFDYEGEPARLAWCYDITERKRAQQAVLAAKNAAAEAESRLMEALEAIPNGFVLYDSDDRLVLCNSKFRDFYQYSEEDAAPGIEYEHLIRLDYERSVVADREEEGESYYRQRRTYRKAQEGSIEVELADGRSILVTEHPTPEGGNAGVQTDITELKRIQEALRESERRLRRILEYSPAAVGIVSPEGGLRFINSRFTEIFGVSRETMDSFELKAFLQDSTARERLQSGEPIRDEELKLTRSDGAEFWSLTSMSAINYKNKPSVLFWAYDITQRKLIEQALEEQSTLLRDVLENIDQGIIMFDAGFRVRAWTRRFQDYTGIPDSLIQDGQSLHNLAMFIAEQGVYGEGEPEVLARKRASSLQSGKPMGSELLIGKRTFDVRSQPTPEGGLAITYTDITERKQAEVALRKAKDEAEKVNRAKSEFLSSMSHELRTPMGSIMGFTQLLRLDSDEPLTPKQQRYVDIIYKDAEHLLSLINELLDLARIEAGKIDITVGSVSVGDVIDECVALIRPLASEHSVTLVDQRPDGELPVVRADHTRLKQVLVNLLSNAVKYNRPRGSVTLSCSRRDSGFLRVTVTDTGPGIPLEKQVALFDPFERLGAEMSATKGTGIGLVLTKRFIELMGGRVGVDSTPGVGSTFWIDIPLETKRPERTEAAAKAIDRIQWDKTSPDGYTLLYVEDSPSSLQFMKELVDRLPGVRLISTDLALTGLKLAREHEPDVIVLDIDLPDMDGFELLARLRIDEATRSIPVLALSAGAMKADIERGLKSGFRDYLTKPVDIARFIAALDALLTESQ